MERTKKIVRHYGKNFSVSSARKFVRCVTLRKYSQVTTDSDVYLDRKRIENCKFLSDFHF